MLKKIFLSGVLLVFIFLAVGCGTLCKGIEGGARGMQEGAKDDWAWLTKATQNSDDWVKNNLW